jgi:hypothetical protein
MRRVAVAAAASALALVVNGCGGESKQQLFAMCDEDGFTEYVQQNEIDDFVGEWSLGPCNKNEPDHIEVSSDVETPYQPR